MNFIQEDMDIFYYVAESKREKKFTCDKVFSDDIYSLLKVNQLLSNDESNESIGHL